MKTPVYLDHHATTPVDPRVLEAMLPFFTEKFGNASSRHHAFGWEAEHAVETARRQVAELIGASPQEIVFTSGATESNNLALKGAAARFAGRGGHIVTAVTEHKAVLDACHWLQQSGFEVTYLPVDRDGLIDLELLRRSIRPDTILVSIMHANNEIGVLQPLAEIGRIARERGVLFHTDAAQSVGKVPIHVEQAHIDLLSLSAHKIYGPKGVGALYVRRKNPRVEIAPQIHGGGHERGLRSGTLNVPGIVGLGKACELCRLEMSEEAERVGRLRDRLKQLLEQGLEDLHINGSMKSRLPNNLNVSFAHVLADSLLMALRDVAVSSGSACSSATQAPSHVLQALGLEPDLARSSIRFGLGRFTTEEEIEFAAARVIETVKRLRELSPLYQALKEGRDLKTSAH
ncbi:MAG: IscS subfamily cysteine desulfurase [Bryobacteraceae bacterium]|nr:IscS subfamily cysteine desulfurase [Bryobacteraceae bacterium]